MRSLTCARCGAAFECGSTADTCWCAAEDFRLPMPPADSTEDCLCADCLRKAAETVADLVIQPIRRRSSRTFASGRGCHEHFRHAVRGENSREHGLADLVRRCSWPLLAIRMLRGDIGTAGMLSNKPSDDSIGAGARAAHRGVSDCRCFITFYICAAASTFPPSRKARARRCRTFREYLLALLTGTNSRSILAGKLARG